VKRKKENALFLFIIEFSQNLLFANQRFLKQKVNELKQTIFLTILQVKISF